MSQIANSARLFRTHLRVLTVAVAMMLVPAVITGYFCFADVPVSSGILFAIILFSQCSAGLIDLLLLFRSYGALRAADALTGEHMYAQNPLLGKALVVLQNLPLSAFLRAVCVRALLSSVITCLVLSLIVNESVSYRLLLSFVLLNISLVPVFPGAYEMFALRPFIPQTFSGLLAYQAALQDEWKRKIWNVGIGTRLAVLVFMIGALPLCALMLSPGVLAGNTIVAIGLLSVVVAISTGMLLREDARKSRDMLLEAMRHLERNKPGEGVNIPSADEFSQLAAGMTSMIAGMKQQTFMRDSFGKFVPRAIVEAVLRNGVKLTGEHRTVALMLVDIRHFDKLVAGHAPSTVVTILNQYLKVVFAGAQHFTGTIERVYAGNVLVVFGAPVVLDAPVERALLAALEIRKGITRLNNKTAAQTPLRISINVHYGRVVAGHIGASERWEYSVIGDAVDSTLGMHAAAGEEEADILVSDAARKESGNDFLYGGMLRAGSFVVHPLHDHLVVKQGTAPEATGA